MLRYRIQDTGWKIAADLFREMRITPLAKLFDKKNDQAKLTALAKSVSQDMTGVKKHVASDQKATNTPLPKTGPNKDQSQSR